MEKLVRCMVTKIFFCADIEKEKKERPKGFENTYCLHIKTSFGRTFNLVGFATLDISQHWIKTLTQVIRSYNVKRALKTWIKQYDRLKTKEISTRTIPAPKEPEKSKKEITEEQNLYRPRFATSNEIEKKNKTSKS